mmetsp:Transcript_57332/g.48457  ORF Transcript_57332/g.48457 Transcript_57332/m.48457 type:complete len:143 (+) Transcript_57332:1038-1466(+)
MINTHPEKQFLVFVETKKKCEYLFTFLNNKGFRCVCIHGDKQQTERRKNLERFKNKSMRILVATDIASRGLDIPDVSVVFNMDMPKDIESYTHRIGRTGRIGSEGLAISCINETDANIINDLYNYIKENTGNVPQFLQDAQD